MTKLTADVVKSLALSSLRERRLNANSSLNQVHILYKRPQYLSFGERKIHTITPKQTFCDCIALVYCSCVAKVLHNFCPEAEIPIYPIKDTSCTYVFSRGKTITILHSYVYYL